MDAEAFREVFREYILKNYDAAWIFEAETKSGYRPVGVFCGHILRKVLFVADVIWFPWASKRNKLETTLHFINEIREHLVVMEFAKQNDKKHWEHICKYGVMRRVGTVNDLAATGEPIALFQSRARVK